MNRNTQISLHFPGRVVSSYPWLYTTLLFSFPLPFKVVPSRLVAVPLHGHELDRTPYCKVLFVLRRCAEQTMTLALPWCSSRGSINRRSWSQIIGNVSVGQGGGF